MPERIITDEDLKKLPRISKKPGTEMSANKSNPMTKEDAQRIQSTQATGGKDTGTGSFAARAQSVGDKNTNTGGQTQGSGQSGQGQGQSGSGQGGNAGAQ
ncbi:MAG: hypothetical protein Q9166_006258 [cf. Caloplaca sp. 2 TL-2023]